MLLNRRLLISVVLIVVGDAIINDHQLAISLNLPTNWIQINNFSHYSQVIKSLQSAFSYVVTEQEFKIIKSDPLFVTGAYKFIFHPLTPTFSADLFTDNLSSQTQKNLIISPFMLNGVNGFAMGENLVNYADPNGQFLDAITLKSETQLSVADINHGVWLVGQSGFQGSFNLQKNEIFSFDFDSLLTSFSDSQNLNKSQQLRFKQSQVIYFWATPTNLDLSNLFLMFSLYPHLSIAVNDSRVDAGLLEIQKNFNSPSINVLEINQNSTQLDNFSYFKKNPNSVNSDSFKWSFKYQADQPVTLNIVAYTSNELTSNQSTNTIQEPQNTSESSGILPLILVGLILLFEIR